VQFAQRKLTNRTKQLAEEQAVSTKTVEQATSRYRGGEE